MPNVSLWQIRKQQINKKILINQSVGEKKLTGFVCLFANKEKRNKNKGNREYFNDIYIYIYIILLNSHHLMLNESFPIEENLLYLSMVMHDDLMQTIMLLMYDLSKINKRNKHYLSIVG